MLPSLISSAHTRPSLSLLTAGIAAQYIMACRKGLQGPSFPMSKVPPHQGKTARRLPVLSPDGARRPGGGSVCKLELPAVPSGRFSPAGVGFGNSSLALTSSNSHAPRTPVSSRILITRCSCLHVSQPR